MTQAICLSNTFGMFTRQVLFENNKNFCVNVNLVVFILQ